MADQWRKLSGKISRDWGRCKEGPRQYVEGWPSACARTLKGSRKEKEEEHFRGEFNSGPPRRRASTVGKNRSGERRVGLKGGVPRSGKVLQHQENFEKGAQGKGNEAVPRERGGNGKVKGED